MSSDIAIKVENLSKCYQIYDQPHDRLKQFVLPRLQRALGVPPKQYFREFWALKDVSFEVKKGETVGIIGRNGSGKSTLLQMICGTLNPTSGYIQTNGRIAALLELGSGFNPEFTGRENVFMNGALLGLTAEQIEKRFEDIATFADIGEFIERPVKTYSSGMFVRLAFATNLMSDPEILIVDEALAVGDMNFQAKCMTALASVIKSGTTVLFVSHDVGSIKSLCSRCVYLDGGTTVKVGRAADVAEQYVRSMREEANNEQKKYIRTSAAYDHILDSSVHNDFGLMSFKHSATFEERVAQFRYGTGEVKVTEVELLDLNGQQIAAVDFNQVVKLRIYIKAASSRAITVNFGIFDDKKNNILGCGFFHLDKPCLITKENGMYLVEYQFATPLQEGVYSIRVNVSSPSLGNESVQFIDVVSDALVFQVLRWSKSRVWSKVHSFAELNIHAADCVQ